MSMTLYQIRRLNNQSYRPSTRLSSDETSQTRSKRRAVARETRHEVRRAIPFTERDAASLSTHVHQTSHSFSHGCLRHTQATSNTAGQTSHPSSGDDAVDVQSSSMIKELFSDSVFMGQFTRSQDATEALQCLSTALQDNRSYSADSKIVLSSLDVLELLNRCLERNNVDLCLSIYGQMTSNLPLRGRGRKEATVWPSVDFEVVSFLTLALTKRMQVNAALNVMRYLSLSTGAAAGAQEVVFGKVISSPLPPFAPMTVVQPQEGVQTVVCAASKYRYEIFSGEVTIVKSESLESGSDVLVSVARFLRLWQKPAIRAVHEMVVTTPTGSQRSFRFATTTADVPAKLTDRVSIVSTPVNNPDKKFGIFAPIPPSTRPGEALMLTNHNTSMTTPVFRAPDRKALETIPSWILPAIIFLAGSDAASSIIDPDLPLIGAASIAAIGVSAVAGNTALLPWLKQIPEERIRAETARQELLRQHQILVTKIDNLACESANDIRSLAKLWQLESKMTAVDATGKYEARIQRIDKARQSLESRLVGRMEVMQGYRRVANMIEIEVEMDVDVPKAEITGIEEQLSKLEEVESLQENLEYQAAAQDELERLLRSAE